MLPDDVKHLINYDEKLIWILRANDTIVLSNQRLIIRKSGGFGLRKSFVDYPYSNMVNIRLEKGIRRSSVEILMRSGVQSVKLDGLSKKDAYQLHRIIRENIIGSSEARPGMPFPVVIAPKESKVNDSDERRCKKCGSKVSEDFSLCPICGYALKLECPECGKQFDRKYKMCPYCGENLSYVEEADLEF
ncbi:MAG: zinc ribbon domain-containing protein [Candidatus Bathyarchaeia archaeon]|jgi:RNA polymerase subunit RPABC4/transcription elongation factor Spt4